MKIDVIMPQMGESIQEGTITKWMKKTGEAVKRDETLFEISTDKVDAEIPSPGDGILAEIRVAEGATVEINTVVAVLETDAAAVAGAPVAAPAAGPSAAVPAPGAPPAAAHPAASPAGAPPAAPPAARPRSEMTAEELRRVRSSPVVRKIAAERGVDIARLQGTGIGGRVTKKDILAAIASPPHAGPPLPAAPVFMPGEALTRVPMTVMRRTIAERMVQSRHTSAHVTTVFEVDFSRIEAIRREKGAAFLERHGLKLTYMPFVSTAVIEALKAFPVVNASVDGHDILYKKSINLGIAVALEWGLIVPVVHDAQDLSLAGVAKAMATLAEKARAKKLMPEEVQGGTFSITNPGLFGSLFGTPIISQPQVAILCLGTIEKRPVVVADAIAIRPMCYLALSFDHRIIDGAIADQFMAEVKRRLQEFDGGLV